MQLPARTVLGIGPAEVGAGLRLGNFALSHTVYGFWQGQLPAADWQCPLWSKGWTGNFRGCAATNALIFTLLILIRQRIIQQLGIAEQCPTKLSSQDCEVKCAVLARQTAVSGTFYRCAQGLEG